MSEQRYTLTVSVVKSEQQPDGLKEQHSVSMVSRNLTLGEATEMQIPLADVMKGFLQADQE